MTGERYLNLVWASVQRQFKYPDSFRRDGLTGSALFSMTLARNGDIVQVELLKSSGNADIDAYVENVICLSRPLPAIPRSMPSPTLALRVLVRVGPETERR
jgi:TonB family protein